MNFPRLNRSRVLLSTEDATVYEVSRKAIISAAPSCDLRHARSHETALELLLSWTFDLAVVDFIESPVYGLLQVLGSRTPPVPTVILSAYAPSLGSFKRLEKIGRWVHLPRESMDDLMRACEDLLYHGHSPVHHHLRNWIRSTMGHVSLTAPHASLGR